MKWWNAFWTRYRSRADRTAPSSRLALWWAGLAMVCFATAGWAVPGAVWMGAAFLLAVWCGADLWQLRRMAAVRAKRDWDAPLQIGVPAAVRIRVSLRGPGAARLAAHLRTGRQPIDLDDGLPFSFVRLSPWRMVEENVSGNTVEWVFTADVVPDRRGEFPLADVDVRWPSPWGWWTRSRRFPQTERVAVVYPDVSTWRKPVLDLHRAHLHEGRHVQAHASGQTQFAYVAEYTPDDDPRRVNWAASARRGRLMKNVYEPERGQQVVIAIDAGRYMDVRSETGKSRLDHAAECAAALAETALAAGDAAGLIAFHNRVLTRVPPGRRPRQREEIWQALARVQAEPVQTNYGSLFASLSGLFQRRGLLIVLSDLAGIAEDTELVPMLHAVRRRHQVLFVSLADHHAIDLARSVPDRVQDVAALAAAAWVLKDRASHLERLHRHSVPALETPAKEAVTTVVREYLVRRRRFVF